MASLRGTPLVGTYATGVRAILNDVFDLRLFGSAGEPPLDSAAASAAAAAAFQDDDVLAALDRSANAAAGVADDEVVDGLDATPGAEDQVEEEDQQPRLDEPVGTDEADDEPTAAKPTVAAGDPNAAPATPAGDTPPPKPAPVNMDEDIELGNGMKMSRATILHTVSNAARIADEVNTFRDVFGMDAATARSQWAPLLEKMRADEAFRNGLQGWINQWVNQHPEGPITDVVDPGKKPVLTAADAADAARQVVRAHEQQRELNAYIQNEIATLKEKYPALRDQKTMLMLGSYTSQNPGLTLTRAAEDLSATLRAIERGATPSEAIVDPSIRTPRKPTAPALVGGNGAAPRGTRATAPDPNEEVEFSDLDESVKDWMKVRKTYGFTD